MRSDGFPRRFLEHTLTKNGCDGLREVRIPPFVELKIKVECVQVESTNGASIVEDFEERKFKNEENYFHNRDT